MTSKKKQKQKPPMPGTFGELFLEAQKKSEIKAVLTQSAPPIPEPQRAQEPEPEEIKPLNDIDFFNQSINELTSQDIYCGKFGRPEDAHWTPPRIANDAPTATAEHVKEVQEIRYFHREVGQLQQRFKDGKYYVAEKHHIDESEAEAVLRRFERKCKGRSVPECDLHHTTAQNVLEILETFVLTAQRKGEKYVRVIHGKGKNSTGAPVLKPLVLQWMNTSTLCCGHAPLIEDDGDFGLTILELRRPTP